MIEVLKQALEALESCGEGHITDGGNQWHDAKLVDTAITSLRQAISELEQRSIEELKSQEPVSTIEDLEQEIYQNTRNFVSLDVMEWMLKRYYTRPPQRTEQEPVAWMDADGNVSDNNDHKCFPIPLYTHPPQEQQSCDKRTWQGLTHEQVDSWELPDCPTVFEFAQFIEAKLKQKNGFAEEKNT